MVQFSSRAALRIQRVAAQVLPANPQHALSGDATVCVTGASGFVGSWLVKSCLERGYRVRACVRNVDDDGKTGFLKAMPSYNEGKLTLHSADMTVPGSYDQIFEGCSTVFHPAEVYMSTYNALGVIGGKKLEASLNMREANSSLHAGALTTAQNIVDSINKSSTVNRLVYTSSVAAMAGSMPRHPIVDESCEAAGSPNDYGPTKRLIEKFFDYAAHSSGGKWSMAIGNPVDIVGPILSPHQATDTWQGKIGLIIQGSSVPQEPRGRPWMLVDVRDVAAAEIHLAESKTLRSGERYLLGAGDIISPEALGFRAMELHPDWDCATTVAPARGTKSVVRNDTKWLRMQIRTDKVRHKIGFEFRSFDETFKATLDALTSVGGIKPRLRKLN